MKIRLFFMLAFFLALPFGFKEITQGFRVAKLQFDFPIGSQRLLTDSIFVEFLDYFGRFSDSKLGGLYTAVDIAPQGLNRKVGSKEPKNRLKVNPLTVSQWECPLDPLVLSIFNQPFTYLERGTQSYVFESRDGKYVVKFFRFDRKQKREKIELLFKACQTAFDRLREETGVVYIHLKQTKGMLPIFRGKDPLGRSIQLPLDRYSFVLQMKAQKLEEVLLGAKGNPAEMRKRLGQFFDLLESRASKGIWNEDSNLRRNFGFLEDRAIELDFASYRTLADLDQRTEIARYTRKLRKWLVKNAPEAISYFDNRSLEKSKEEASQEKKPLAHWMGLRSRSFAR